MPTLKHRDTNGIELTKELKAQFPAVFNKRRSVNVSEDYQLYRSDEIIDIMGGHGMKLVELSQEQMRWSKKRHPHTQIHALRFRPEVALQSFGVGDSFPEIVIMNSHDGRAVFRAMAGIFRLVCSNGMVVADANFGTVRRRHFGEANSFAKVKEIIADLPRVVTQVSESIGSWSALNLTADQQLALAKRMLELKTPSGSIRGPEWLQPEQVLEARRVSEAPKDGKRDLWTTFNVLQENLTNAEISTPENFDGRRRSIRPLTGVPDNIGFNQRLWTTAADYFTAAVDGMEEGERKAFDDLRAKRVKAAAKPVLLPA